MATSTTFSAQFLQSSPPPDTKILIPRISFRLTNIYVENQYDINSRTCTDGLSILWGVELTVSYAHVAGILSLYIIIAISFAECLIIFVLDISNAFQNTISPNSTEIVYLSLPYIYLYSYKRKFPKHPWALSNQN